MSSIKKRNMTSEIAIKVENLSKVYNLRQPREDEERNVVYEHKALRDVSFEIKRGESVGIIGPNGSGKSTLLKILAGVIKPSSGKVTIKGRVASILDIGAGFHPELSGRENVYLNGQIHGFSQKEIEERYDEIVAFSGIEKFIDEPVKNYSNGMYLRLAFSVMAHLDFDVYLFDEVLSVGDAEFKEKVFSVIHKLQNQGKTIVVVSHIIEDVIDANRIFLIENGAIINDLPKKEILRKYFKDESITFLYSNPFSIINKEILRNQPVESVRNIMLYSEDGKSTFDRNEEISFYVKIQKIILPNINCNIIFYDRFKNPILNYSPIELIDLKQSDDGLIVKFIVPPRFFIINKFYVDIVIYTEDKIIDFIENVFQFSVTSEEENEITKFMWGAISPDFKSSFEVNNCNDDSINILEK